MNSGSEATIERGGMGWPKILLIVLLTTLVSVGLTLWLGKAYFFPSDFKPVTLNAKEEQVLDAKLATFEGFGLSSAHASGNAADSARPAESAKPEAYSEAGAVREVTFSEKELNAMLAKNTDLAHKVAIDLSESLISANVLMPMDPDFPIFGGKTLRGKAGVEFAFDQGRPIVRLKGISIMGVPIPNAWMGGLKNIDLIQEFGNQPGFWKSFADGIESLKVEDGKLMVKLKE